MSELKKIKSQELLDRLFNANVRQNYYEHHNMPTRNNYRNFLKSSHAYSSTNFKAQSNSEKKNKI